MTTSGGWWGWLIPLGVVGSLGGPVYGLAGQSLPGLADLIAGVAPGWWVAAMLAGAGLGWVAAMMARRGPRGQRRAAWLRRFMIALGLIVPLKFGLAMKSLTIGLQGLAIGLLAILCCLVISRVGRGSRGLGRPTERH